MSGFDKLKQVLHEALDGRLRALVEVCNCADDRAFLAARLAEEIVAAESASWSETWPTEPGYYWFYGWPFKSRCHNPELHFVRAFRTANSLALVTNGHFLYRTEGGEGYWMPARVPELPTQEDSNG